MHCLIQKQLRLLGLAGNLNYNSGAAFVASASFDIAARQQAKLPRGRVEFIHEPTVSFKGHFDC
jgi:hypothetical protein